MGRKIGELCGTGPDRSLDAVSEEGLEPTTSLGSPIACHDLSNHLPRNVRVRPAEITGKRLLMPAADYPGGESMAMFIASTSSSVRTWLDLPATTSFANIRLPVREKRELRTIPVPSASSKATTKL